MKLTTIGQKLWKGARKAEQLRAAGADNPTVQARLQKLKLVEALKKRGVPWSEIQALIGISRAPTTAGSAGSRKRGLKA